MLGIDNLHCIEDIPGEVSTKQRYSNLFTTIQAKTDSTGNEYSKKATLFLDWHKRKWPKVVNRLIRPGHVMEWLNELDKEKLHKNTIENKVQTTFNGATPIEVVRKKFFSNGTLTFPEFEEQDLESIECMLISGELSAKNHIEIEEWLEGHQKNTRLPTRTLTKPKQAQIHSIRTKALQGYLSGVQFFLTLQNEILNLPQRKLLEDNTLKSWKKVWQTSEREVREQRRDDKHSLGNTIHDYFSPQDVLKLANKYVIDNPSASGTRFRSMVLLQYQCGCRGDDARDICISDLCIVKHDGSPCLYMLRKRGEYILNSVFFIKVNVQSILFIHKLIILITNCRENKCDELG